MQVTKEDIREMAIRGEDITQLDVSHLTDMSHLFYDDNGYNENGEYISSLQDFNQDISRWDVSNVTNMSCMFYGCSSFNQDISGWNVSNVNDLRFMFAHCYSFNQDLSRWDVSNVTNMSSMFTGCSSLNQDISAWDVSQVKNISGIFYSCSSLSYTQYWNVHPDCKEVPEKVIYFPLACSRELKQKILTLLKENTLEEVIIKLIDDSSTNSKERYELLKHQQQEQVKELILQEGNR